ncbi:malto-oligosyltrehalose synthase [Rhodopseudomonas palustris TIE-1]|uniref:malto-oligosyltrehalose synthase n=1 Tax=Rhodopseudomonas palustris TaxID=1076 RepID=UPI00017798AB|nr:malto-oligosyltrehalose synthase [Rhodopseudomonas palustris]ACF02664.1 malto-oligosyltrehalose synthase [Rhodopseudomonas palustris TIE-1]
MPPAIPTATYRLQLTADFGFDAATAIVPYLKRLGISHVYASPFMKARKGSTHGYDIVDHTKLNPELGGEEGFARLSAALKQHDIGLILDFVPNHVGVHYADNPWWLDVLEWGPASPHAASFDIDWEMLPFRARGGVLLPIIGSSYGKTLEAGEIELRYDAADGSFSAWYYEHRLPIAPQRYSEILRTIVREAGAENSDAGRAILDLAARYTGLGHPSRKEAPEFKAALQAIPGAAEVITRGLNAYRAGEGRIQQIQALHNLLERQHYKLGHWQLASSEINYRRFFDVNTLAGLRVEDAGTFEAIHSRVKKLLADGQLQGLRLDHIDGLRDPAQYFQRLRRLARDAQGAGAPPLYTVIEKILGEGEALHRFAGVHGTTGYEWLNVITRVLLDGRGLKPLDETWRQASNLSPAFDPVLKAAKRRVLETLLLSEFTVLTRLLARIASGHYSTRDFSADNLRQVFELYVLHFPVYRTYLTGNSPTQLDRKLIEDTIAKARADWFGADDGIFEFLKDVLTMDLVKPGRALHSKPRVRRFALKVQQFTGPTMAKSLEDTAFYRYHRLLALNEVGGDPAAPEMPIAAFHDAMQSRAKDWPHGMTATMTHDAKRGEDARARLLSLAEIPGEWASAVGKWKLLNAPHLVVDGDMRAPSPAFEYMLYQALIGAWPLSPDPDFTDRFQGFALKAAREGKQETNWLNPNLAYEEGIRIFIDRLLDPKLSGPFLESVDSLHRRLSLLGALNGLSQLTLKATMPGVPDFYQGTEFWDFSLVDPDNRRPVDFDARAAALESLDDKPDWKALTAKWSDGRVKLAWTHHLLKLRRDHAALFSDGDYRPLAVKGAHRDHIVAFARTSGSEAVIVVVAKGLAALSDEGRQWPTGDAFDGAIETKGYAVEIGDGETTSGELQLRDLFRHLPVSVHRARLTGAKRVRRG